MEKSGSPCWVCPEGDDEGKCDRKRRWSAAFVGRYTATISRDYCLEIRKPPLHPSRHHPSVYHDPEKMDCTMTTTMDIRIYSIMHKIYIIILYRRTRWAATAWAAAVATAVSCARRTPFIKKYYYYHYYDAYIYSSKCYVYILRPYNLFVYYYHHYTHTQRAHAHNASESMINYI